MLQQKYDLSRREFIRLSCATSLMPIIGCSTVTKYIIPALIEEGLEEIIKFFATHFYNQFFSAGEMLESSNSNIPNIVANQQHKEIANQFTMLNGINSYFASPVSLHTKDSQSRYIQLAAKNDKWSLSTGGFKNEKVLRIHNVWLQWLLEEDNCSLRFNGNSRFENCGVDGCLIKMAKQDFLNVDNESVILQKVSSTSGAENWITAHENHGDTWRGCKLESTKNKSSEITFCPPE